MKRSIASDAVWLAGALAMHAVLLVGPWKGLTTGPSYAVAPPDAVELGLVESAPPAAEPSTMETPAPAPEPEAAAPSPQPPLPSPEPPKSEPIPAPEALPISTPPPPRVVAAATPKSKPAPSRSAAASTSTSSPKPGPSATNATTGAAGSASGNSKPGYLYNPQPPYPAASRAAREQGSVLLAVSIDEAGRVTSLSVKQSSGFPRLDAAARTGVTTWRFRPAKVAGVPVASKLEVPVRFRLAN